MLWEKIAQLIDAERFRVEIPLAGVAAEGPQFGCLGFGFNAFRHCVQKQDLREVDDRLGNRRRF